MGEVREHRPVLRLMAISSRHETAFEWAQEQAQQAWGPIVLSSPRFDFSETHYYTKSMGEGLLKQVVAFEELIDQSRVVESKIESNAWEQEYRAAHDFPEARPLNLDPGYLTEAKLILATTKDRDHRVYLRKGILAEVTLFYQGNRWQGSRWTYPDYLRSDVVSFLDECRDWLRKRYGAMAAE